VPVDRALARAPTLQDRPVAVVGTWPEDGRALLGDRGRLPVDGAAIEPEPGPVLVWGRIAYEPGQAAYELEAQRWRPWQPSPR